MGYQLYGSAEVERTRAESARISFARALQHAAERGGTGGR